jgi:hypothetical protein
MHYGTDLPLLRLALEQVNNRFLHFHISKILAVKISPLLGKPHAKPLYEFPRKSRMAISPPQSS